MSRRNTIVASLICVALVFDAATFLIMAALHLGARIPLGFGELETDPILAAAIVEGLIGLAMVTGAIAVFTHSERAWASAVVAHLFATAGVLVGIGAIAAGRGPHSVLNDTYHRVILVVLLVGLVGLLSPAGRAALDEQTSPRPGAATPR